MRKFRRRSEDVYSNDIEAKRIVIPSRHTHLLNMTDCRGYVRGIEAVECV